MKELLKTFLLSLAAATLAACAGAAAPDSQAVQDIQPGEKSVIQPPQTGGANAPARIEERNI